MTGIALVKTAIDLPLFLTAIELRELTGFVIKERQIAQLRDMGVTFMVNGRGKECVSRANWRY
jgi:hypothetical protein